MTTPFYRESRKATRGATASRRPQASKQQGLGSNSGESGSRVPALTFTDGHFGMGMGRGK